MKTLRLPEFLMQLPPPLGYKGISLTKNMIDKIIYCLNIRDRYGHVYYPEVMWAVLHAVGGYNTDEVLKCQENKNIIKDVKKKFRKLAIIEKETEIFNKVKNEKETVKEV